MANPAVTYTFTNGTTADASQVNQNFTDLINSLTDGTKSLSISALTAASTLTANGNVVLGASSSNTLTFNGSIASAVPLSANTSWDIGSSTLGLQSVYFGGTSTYTVRVKATTMSGSYTLLLPPAAPGTSGSLLQMDTGGQITTTLQPAVTTLTIGSGGPSLSYNASLSSMMLSSGYAMGFTSGSNKPQIGNLSGSTNSLAITNTAGDHTFPLVVSATPATNGLMIVRGTFHFDGAAVSQDNGEGATITRQSQGHYTITFTHAFLDVPCLIGTGMNCIFTIDPLGSQSGLSIQFIILTTGGSATDGTNATNAISYMAIGQRGSSV